MASEGTVLNGGGGLAPGGWQEADQRAEARALRTVWQQAGGWPRGAATGRPRRRLWRWQLRRTMST
eukprot:7729837-Pyramimonas_sp.AAC.1